MANELTGKTENLVALLGDKSLADVIKPLKTEIYLFDTYVAGTTHLQDKSVLQEITMGDRLLLIREDNKYDSNAIMIFREDSSGRKKLGYVPEKDNVVFARLMDAGKLLIGKINTIEVKGTFTKISIGIYLVDF